MKYTFEINIGSVATPVEGGGWVEVQPLKVGNMGKKEESYYLFFRDFISGDIQFYSDVDYALRTLVAGGCLEIGIRIKYLSVVAITGVLSLAVANNETQGIGTYEVKTETDQYTTILQNYEEVANVLNLYKHDTFADMPFSDLVFNLGAFTDGFAGTVFWTNVTPAFTIYARRQLRVSESQANALDIDGWTELDSYVDNSKLMVRNWDHSGTPYNTPTGSDVYSGTYYAGPINYVKHSVVAGVPYSYTKLYELGSCWHINNFTYFDNYIQTIERYFTYSRTFRLDAAISYVVKNADSSIKFDQYSFELLYSNSNYRHILLSSVSDFILEGQYVPTSFLIPVTKTLIEKSNSATVGDMSMKSIFDEYLTPVYKIFWYLELIDGDYYFRLRTFSDITPSAASSGNDLTTYKGINVTESGNKYKYRESDLFYKFIRIVIASDIEHIGRDIVIPAYENSANNKEINLKFYSDIDDAINSKYVEQDKYPIDNEGYFIMACDAHSGVDIGSGMRLVSSSLAYSYSGDDLTLTSDGTSFTLQGIFETALSSSVIRRGFLANIKFDATVLAGSIDRFEMYLHVFDSYGTIDEYKPLTITEGSNDIYLIVDDVIVNSTTKLNIRINVNHEVYVINSVLFEGFSLSQFFTQYYVQKPVSILSQMYKNNAPVGIANIDNVWGKNNIPASSCQINGVTVAISDNQKTKIKEFEFLSLHDIPSDIDGEMYVKTDQGNEFLLDSIEIPLDGSTAKIKIKGV